MIDRTAPAVNALLSAFVTKYPDEAAAALDHSSPALIAQHLAAQTSSASAAVVDRLTSSTGAAVIAALPARRAALALGSLDPGRAVALLAWLDEVERERLLGLVDPSLARELRAMAE